MKKRGIILSLLAISLMLSAIALATVTISSSDSSIDSKYYSNEDLRGSLRIKFNSELAGDRFNGVFAKSGRISEKEGKTLREVLDEAGIAYSCSPSTCQDSYALSTGEATKTISMMPNETRLTALKIVGTSIVFESLTFNMDIMNSQTCKNPMQIDFFDDGIIDFQAWNMTEDYSCSTTPGCFNISLSSYETLTINPSGVPYCEKVILPASEKIRLGAKVTKGNSEGDLKMMLYSTNGEWLSDCDLPEPTSANEEDVTCIAEYSYPETEEFYICINSEGGNYKIRSETINPCGFDGGPEDFDGEFVADYYLFASTPTYASIGTISEANFEELSYGGIENYLQENYDNNCKTGCSIPIKLISNSQSSIDVYNLSFIYGKRGGTVDENNIYNAVKNPLKLTAGNYSILQIESLGIKVPENAGTYGLELNLGDEEIMSKDITVEKVQVIKFLYPKFVAYKNPTNFGLITDSSVSLTNYLWDFGDGTTEETTTGFVSHAYANSGAYPLKVTATTALGRSFSQEFNITVASARDSANISIEEYQKMINNVSSSILRLPAWSQSLVKEMIDLNNMTSQIIEAKQKFKQASSDADYAQILDSLLAMKVPSKIKEISAGELPYYFNYNEIDKSILSSLGAGENANVEKLAGWVFANEDLILNYKFIEIQYSNEEGIFGILNLKINPKEGKDIENYIVINGEVKFKQDYGQKEADGSYGIAFNNLGQREIEFLQYNANKFTDIKIYASPAFDALLEAGGVCDYDEACEPEESESWRNCTDCKPWGIAFWIVLGVLVIGGVAGYFIWKWYKNEYENKLFKDKSKLYNLMSFVKTSKAQKLSKGEIYAKLRKEGWNGEQIEYAMMQLEGSIWAKIFFRKSTIERLESLGLPVCLKY